MPFDTRTRPVQSDREPGTGDQRAAASPTIEPMTIQHMHHVGIVVDDLAAATEFFVELGLKLQGEASVEGGWVDRVVGLEGVRSEVVMLETPDGQGRIELAKFRAPSGPGPDRDAPANAPGIRHVTFEVDDLDAALAAVRARGGEPRRRGRELPGHLSALLRTRPRGDHRRARREGRLTPGAPASLSGCGSVPSVGPRSASRACRTRWPGPHALS